MKYFLATLAIVGSVLAFPMGEGALPTSLPTYSTTYPVTSTPSSAYTWSTPFTVSSSSKASPTFKVSPTRKVTSHASSVSASATPTCEVDSDGDNGNHYGWCKKAQHSGTYKNGKSDGDSD